MEETINDRIEMLVNERFDGNKAAFAKSIGLPAAGLSNYLSIQRRSKPSVDMIAKIITTLDVDAHWLITGEYKTSTPAKSNDLQDNSLREELIRLRAENDVLRELAGLRKKTGTVAV